MANIPNGLSALVGRLRPKSIGEGRKATHVRISPYAPHMADESDGIEAMRRVLGDVEPEPLSRVRSVQTPTRAAGEEAGQDPNPKSPSKRSRRKSTLRASEMLPVLEAAEESLRPQSTMRRRTRQISSLLNGVRLSTSQEPEPAPSPRTEARIASDPFVRRLDRLR
ncbi:MAG: hypothetical protein AAFR47_21175 [Pseudomonadota bacterium]